MKSYRSAANAFERVLPHFKTVWSCVCVCVCVCTGGGKVKVRFLKMLAAESLSGLHMSHTPCKFRCQCVNRHEHLSLQKKASMNLSFSHVYSQPVAHLSLCCYFSVTKHVQFFATPWTAACQHYLSLTISQSLLRFISIESVILIKTSVTLFICLQSFPA